MHRLSPGNTDALFLLVRAWSGAAVAFIEDDYEVALDSGDEALAEHHKARARAAHDRAVHYGGLLLELKVSGFREAKRNYQTIRDYALRFDSADAVDLLTVGQAWLSRISFSPDDQSLVAETYVGATLVERAVELDENVGGGMGAMVLGAYHARFAMAELDESQKWFEKALRIQEGKVLITQFQMAKTYYCMRVDRTNYERQLRYVLDRGDVSPERRFLNLIAKRRAARYLTKERMADCGF
jgi:tetratricopeptide (TPR) repeat protein